MRWPETPGRLNRAILVKTFSEIVKNRCGDYQHPRRGCWRLSNGTRGHTPRQSKGEACAAQIVDPVGIGQPQSLSAAKYNVVPPVTMDDRPQLHRLSSIVGRRVKMERTYDSLYLAQWCDRIGGRPALPAN